MKKPAFVRNLLLMLSFSAGLAVLGCSPTVSTAPSGTTAPTVASIVPAREATGVAINTSVVATFSEAMDSTTVTAANFTLKTGTTAVTGTVTYVAAGNIATFKPNADLTASTTYTATILTGVKDATGNALAAVYSWSFTTGTTADTTAPTVASIVPAKEATGVAINSSVVATFSEAMDSTTVTAANFTLKSGTTAVTGTVTYIAAGNVATFKPNANLVAGTPYTATISTGVKDVAGNALAAAYSWSFTTGATANTTPPTVASTVPVSGATSVAVNSTVMATFSEAMDPTTITATNFTIAGVTATTVVYNTATMTATFTPNANLTANTSYTATISTGVKDLSGNALATAKVWTFTTGATADTTPPKVASSVPTSGATGVAIGSTVTATFSKAMDPTTITAANFTIAGVTATTVAYNAATMTATFTPNANLIAGTTYTATISTGVKDLAGNALAAVYSWSFTTLTDTTPPTVSSVLPGNSATGVAINGGINATFSEAMNTATIVPANFTLAAASGTAVTGTVTYNGATNTATFVPAANLAANTGYTATITTGVKDVAGNALAAAKVWTFTTTAQGSGPAPVLLGSAINYVILAETEITTVPQSSITGDTGLSPAAESYYTGFSTTDATGYATSTQVTGNIYAADMAAPTPANLTKAISDMGTAYNDAAGRPHATTATFLNVGGGTLTNLTLAPGLYTWGSAVTIPTNLTLSGGANDVWIFQMSGDLTLASAVKVILSGGAQAKNIFWQIGGGSGAILGSTSHLEGIVLSATAVTFKTGSSLKGRALAQTAVILDTTTLTTP